MLVLAVSVLACLKDQLVELYIDFGVEKHRKYVSVRIIFKNLGESRVCGLSFFHAFNLNQSTLSLIEHSLPIIEKVTVLLHNRASSYLKTIECRKDLLCKGRKIDNIPPTRAALLKYVLLSYGCIGCMICMGTINSCKPSITGPRIMGMEQGRWEAGPSLDRRT